MSKEEATKFLKIKTFVLKVHIHCDGCKKKVKKLLHKIDGVYTTNIDAEQGKVTVSGNVDLSTIIKKLSKAGKHAEIWASKGGEINFNLNNQLQNYKLGNVEEQQNEKGEPQKGGDKKGLMQLQQQVKEFKDVKFSSQKDQKSVKPNLPPEDGGDYDDEFDDFDEDDEDGDLDDVDGLDDDLNNDPKKMKPMSVLQPNVNGGSKIGGGGNGTISDNPPNGEKKGGGGKIEALGKSTLMDHASSGMGQMGNMHVPIGQMGNFPAAATAQSMVPRYYQGGMVAAPEMVAATNPYQQQQYLAAMIQRQRMMMNSGHGGPAFHPMAYGYGQPPHYENREPYTNMFCDENPNSCSIM
ncbi:uncharacterized protein [Typha latifolia]|uniref:uncharacterized protein n=1 Tax=Typha latifolia TaxID=4733 RepID=UPI003C2C6011